jgi:hypothetical protein
MFRKLLRLGRVLGLPWRGLIGDYAGGALDHHRERAAMEWLINLLFFVLIMAVSAYYFVTDFRRMPQPTPANRGHR